MRAQFNQNNAEKRTAASDHGNHGGSFFALATDLARKAKYSDAAKALQAALSAEECSESDALDLQARIYAQQGQYLRAETCWDRAKQLDGSNPAYDKALRRLNQSRLPASRLLQLSSALAIMVILSMLVWQILFVKSNTAIDLNMSAAELSAIREDISAIQDSTEARYEELTIALTDLNSHLGGHGSPLADLHENPSTASREKHTSEPTTVSTSLSCTDEVMNSLKSDLLNMLKPAR